MPHRPAHAGFRTRGRAGRSRPGSGACEPRHARDPLGGRPPERTRRHAENVGRRHETEGRECFRAPCRAAGGPSLQLDGGSDPGTRPSSSTPAPGIQRIRMVEEWIDAHLADPITLGRLCAVAGVGDRYLESAFRAHRGQTPAAIRGGPAACVGAAMPSRLQAGRFGHATGARCRLRPSRQVCRPLPKHLRRVAFGNAAAQLEPASRPMMRCASSWSVNVRVTSPCSRSETQRGWTSAAPPGGPPRRRSWRSPPAQPGTDSARARFA